LQRERVCYEWICQRSKFEFKNRVEKLINKLFWRFVEMEKYVVLKISVNEQTQKEMGENLEKVVTASYDGEYLHLELADGSTQSIDLLEAERPPLLPPKD
jgi:hypothetical protein